MLNGFVYLLRAYGVPVGLQQVMDFYHGLQKGLADHVDRVFVLARLCFVKRVEQMDAFERAFAYYFYGVDIPKVKEGDPGLFHTKQFRAWLAHAIRRGDLPRNAFWSMPREELMRRFWDTVRRQMEAHHGGNRWIGTGGTSPFGHSGFSQRGIRVHGESRRRSAVKVIGERRYVDYSSSNTLKGENLRQALATMKNMLPAGPYEKLDLDATIDRTSRNGGEIELVFRRELRDKIKVVLLLDNGGYSMLPFLQVVQLLFSKMHSHFRDCTAYFFHNTIYGAVYKDANHLQPLMSRELLRKSPDTRVVIVGDASMAPEELVATQGSIGFDDFDAEPSMTWLKRIHDRFPYSVWLNPIPKDDWPHTYGRWTLSRIREIFHMEDLTLGGIKAAVDFLNARKTG